MWERLQTISKLGQGGMGEVFKVYDPSRAKFFAAKKLRTRLARPEDVIRFSREMENIQALRHPNIVEIIEVSTTPDAPGYLMELCPHGSVEDMSRSFRGNVAKCEELLDEISSGLKSAHLHPRRIIHRDIKPSNILLGDDNKFKISDFGLSVQLEGTQSRITSTSSNWVSQGFSPPEQAFAFKDVTELADVFSLAATVYYLYTGAHFTEPLRSSDTLSGIPDPLGRLLERCLLLDRFDRLPNGAAVVDFFLCARSPDLTKRYMTLRPVERRSMVLDPAISTGALEKLRSVEPDRDIRNILDRKIEEVRRSLEDWLQRDMDGFWTELLHAMGVPMGAVPLPLDEAYDYLMGTDDRDITEISLDEFIALLPESFATQLATLRAKANKITDGTTFARKFFEAGIEDFHGLHVSG